jgi:Tfp pilus assembly PilM family ATPase
VILARRTGWIGVDLGSHAVKLAQVERTGGGQRLREAIIIARQTPWGGGDSREAPASSSEQVCAALALGGHFVGRRAACALPTRLCDLAPLEIPRGSEPERRAAIAQTLASLDKGAHGQGEFDFWDVETPKEGRRDALPNVNVMSVTSEWTRQVTYDMAKARLRCEVLDGMPLALARAAQMDSSVRADELTAVVDWGFHSATFCVVFQGRPLFVRPLRECGLTSVVQSVCDAMGVSPDEAHIVLRKHGLPPANDQAAPDAGLPAAIGEVVAEPLGRMVAELNRTLEYLRGHRSAMRPARVLLFGGGATIRNVAGLLSRKIGLDVGVWRFPHTSADRDVAPECPPEMLGPAIALSSLAWAES